MKHFLLVTLLLIAFDFQGYSQLNDLDNSKRYIQIVIDSEVSQEQELQINTALSQLAGAETSRMDKITGVFLGIYIPNDAISGQTFLDWFTSHGHVIKCYYDAVYTQGGMINLSKTSCP